MNRNIQIVTQQPTVPIVQLEGMEIQPVPFRLLVAEAHKQCVPPNVHLVIIVQQVQSILKLSVERELV